MKKYLSRLWIPLLALALVIPARAANGPIQRLAEAPKTQKISSYISLQASTRPELQTPSQEEIRAKWETVTYASSLYAAVPSVSAPYEAGQLSEDFLESGITYLNYVRFVAGLPEITLDETLTADAQHGAVVLAAIDQLTHFPHQPGDMEDAFFERGYGATSTANISARWGYAPLSCIQGSIQGCMDDSGENNLATLGHRRWLLNPSLGKVGFGYAQSATDWSYVVTPVFDYSGTGCSYDFISWPVAGNHPTNLFDVEVPWSLTLNPSVYQTPSLGTVQITITREADGKQWHFDQNTGDPVINTDAYMTVNNEGYGVQNCIIFHPGSRNVDGYTGTFRVDVSGIFLRNGTETTLSYDVNFFDVDAVCTEHSYEAVITSATCTEEGYTTFTCSLCGHSYVDCHVEALGHDYAPIVLSPTCEHGGYTTYVCTRCDDAYVSDYTDPVDHVYEDGYCKWCGRAQSFVKFTSISTSLGGNIALNFYVQLSQDLLSNPDAYMQFTYAARTIQVPICEGRPSSGNAYVFSCPITSKNMTDVITAQVMVGSEAVGDAAYQSVANYCRAAMEYFPDDEKTVNLMKAMLNYGASAQMLFDYRTDDLANASLAEADKVLSAVDASAFAHSLTGQEDGIIASSCTLLLNSETTVRCYFKLTGNKSIDEYTFTVNGVEVEPTYKSGYYYIEKQNIAAHRLDDMIVFTCGGITVNYGGLSYVNQIMNSYTEGTTFDMASALFAYSKATEAFIG